MPQRNRFEGKRAQERERIAPLTSVQAQLTRAPTVRARTQAESRLPAPLRGKADHAACRPALEVRIREGIAAVDPGPKRQGQRFGPLRAAWPKTANRRRN